jgi:8-oxo-dGTP diphosphatase
MDTPRIGTALLIWKDGKVLLGKRLSKNGYGAWSPPGGKLESNELSVDCAIREAKEETGLDVTNPRFITYTDEIDAGYVTLHFEADWTSGEPVPEENKSERWTWFDWNDLPSPLFSPFENLVKNGYKGRKI